MHGQRAGGQDADRAAFEVVTVTIRAVEDRGAPAIGERDIRQDIDDASGKYQPLAMEGVVVRRRIMGALPEGGYVSSERGPNGGWRLERPLREITFLNIYKAFEPGSPFTIATSDDHPKCVVERSANRALSRALSEAAALFEQALSKITLDQLLPGKGQAAAGDRNAYFLPCG
jgi:DNA-binding IscR family transcriptional regulator